jgi:GT2 family glycosyltransferase
MVIQHFLDDDIYLCLLNPDVTVEPGTFSQLAGCAEKAGRDSVMGCRVMSFEQKNKLLLYGGGRIRFASGTVAPVRDVHKTHRLDYISGGCLFTHASNFKKHGLLPEDYFLYWEETDWCYKAKQGGAQLSVCPGATCYDKISTSIGSGFMADYYYARNGLRFVSKYRKRNVPLVVSGMILRLLKRFFTGKWPQAKGIYKGTVDYFKGRTHAYQ